MFVKVMFSWLLQTEVKFVLEEVKGHFIPL